MAQRALADPASELTDADKALLTVAQLGVPIVAHPFAALGDSIGLAEAGVIERLRALKGLGMVRKIGPVIEPSALGLASELVAARVEPSLLDAVGQAAAVWPEVTHCYAREHEVNLWLAGVAASAGWFGEAAEELGAMHGVEGVWRLPTIRRFKISVFFPLAEVGGDQPLSLGASGFGSQPGANSLVDTATLRALQRDLPLSPEPFRELAAQTGGNADHLMRTLTDLISAGVVRRYGALVNHRSLGFAANAMLVMAVPPESIQAAGEALAGSQHVSHCYERPPFAGFPYNLYAMVHSRSRHECLDTATRLVAACPEITDWRALFSNREYGKSSPDYAALLTKRLQKYGEAGSVT